MIAGLLRLQPAVREKHYPVSLRGRLTGSTVSDAIGKLPEKKQDGKNLARQIERAPVSIAELAYSFGPFQVLPNQRLLLEGERSVRLGSRAFDILIALIERPGELVAKQELIAHVWPSTHVDEGNLKFQVGALRRALGDGRDGRRYVETSPGQGYRFVAPVAIGNDSALGERVQTVRAPRHNLPGRITPLIGREDLIGRLVDQFPRQGLLTLVGPGGIGKTSVAVALAERKIGVYDDGVWFVDMPPLAEPAFLRNAVALAVGVEPRSGDVRTSLITALRDKRLLLVLNDCAHMVDCVAHLVVDLLREAPGVQIVAASREPLHVEGERVIRLGPLNTPPTSELLTAADALCYPAVQLFVEQAAANASGFDLRDEDAPIVSEICRKLDGNPLAIELAAVRVGVLGVRGLAARLDDRFQVLTSGRRTALARHQTLRATLDWSYGLLTAAEQAVFIRLAIFDGKFTLAAAAAVAGDAIHAGPEIVELVLELTEKSLLVADVDEPEPHFHLSNTTRAYALEKLTQNGERELIVRRLAEYIQQHGPGA